MIGMNPRALDRARGSSLHPFILSLPTISSYVQGALVLDIDTVLPVRDQSDSSTEPTRCPDYSKQ